MGTVTEQEPVIARPRERLTARAGRRATRQAGRGRPFEEFADPSLPEENNRLGRTLYRWKAEIANWHVARVTNAATDGGRPPTTSPNASNASPTGSPTSPTTGSAPCSMPANPTGRYSTPSLHPETRSAGIRRSPAATHSSPDATSRTLRFQRSTAASPG